MEHMNESSLESAIATFHAIEENVRRSHHENSGEGTEGRIGAREYIKFVPPEINELVDKCDIYLGPEIDAELRGLMDRLLGEVGEAEEEHVVRRLAEIYVAFKEKNEQAS